MGVVVGRIATMGMSFLKTQLLLSLLVSAFAGISSYERPPARQTLSIPHHDSGHGSSTQQVHISLVGQDKMRISWVTDKEAPSTVNYGTAPGSNHLSATGTSSSYEYMLYKSGRIHEAVISSLKPNQVYYYRCGPDSAREFCFKTPPAQFPIKFAVAGDLGQTGWTNSTLQHIGASEYDVLLLPGDLSYADSIQDLWDSFGRLVEPLASQHPWMVTIGNHEVEKIPLLHGASFTSYNARWRMPFEESGSDSNLYYSFDVAGVHVIMLGSYADFGPRSAQYKWLQGDLGKVDRKLTPWVFTLIHAPWYNSNTAHQGEDESVEMKKDMEELLYEGRVDLVFAGHVHAYERFTRVYKGEPNKCGAVHITIGDGGNREGLAKEYIDPKPSISIVREASFGHGQLDVVNATHTRWTWHRNEDDEAVEADSVWLRSLASDPSCHP